MEGGGRDKADVFEVFKFGQLDKATLSEMPLEELRRKYVVLQPLTSLAQLEEDGVALGKAAPDRMVVDREQFKQQVAKKIQEAVAMQRSEQIETALQQLRDEAEDMFRKETRRLQHSVREQILELLRDADLPDDKTAELEEKVLASFRELRLPERGTE